MIKFDYFTFITVSLFIIINATLVIQYAYHKIENGNRILSMVCIDF